MTAASRLLACVSLLIACAVALAACGSSAGGPHAVSGKSAQEVLRETFGPGHAIHSGVVSLTIAADSQGSSAVSGPVDVQISGPFEGRGARKAPRFALMASVDGAGRQLKAGVTSTGAKGYVSVSGRTYDVGDSAYRQFTDAFAEPQKAAAAGRCPRWASIPCAG